ncbi:hypothetical protein LTS17_012722 [Exophiala oligosperma]
MNDNIDEVSAQGSSLVAYRPQGKRIRVIQQFLKTILEDDTVSEPPRQPSERDDDGVHPYDFIGAVGIKTDRRGKKTVRYHVKWKGYGIKSMTWEPESHIFEGDLLELWSKYGRICAIKKLGRQTLRQRMQQLRQCHSPEVRETNVREMAQADHVTSPESPEVVEAPCEQNVERDCGGDGLLFSKDPNPPAEFDGADGADGVDGGDGGDLSRYTPPPSPTARRSPAPSQQSFIQFGDSHQNSLESIPQPEFLDTSQGLQSPEVTSSGQSDSQEIKPTETVGPASVLCDVSVHHASTSHDKAKRKRWLGRTKTGCLSCRRRKVKCDERRPSCVNCVRLKIHCEGYDSGPRWMKPHPTTMPTMGQYPGAKDTTMFALARQSESRGRLESHFLPNKCLNHSDEYHKKPEYLPRLAELDWPILGREGHGEWSLKLKDTCGRQSPLLMEVTPKPIQPSNPRPTSYYPRALPTYASLPQPLEPSILYGSDIAQQSRLGELLSPLRRLTELYDLSSAG